MHRLVTVRTHDDFLVLPHNDLISHSVTLHTEQTSPCPILLMSNTRSGSDKYKFKSHRFDLTGKAQCFAREARALSI